MSRSMLCIFIFFWYSCIETKKTSVFHRLTHLDKVYEPLDSTDIGQEYQYIVISNPPNRLDSLFTLIQKYNDTTLNACTIEKQKNLYLRRFFKESTDTPIDFENKNDFTSDYITDHTEDLLAFIEFNPKFGWTFKVKYQNRWKNIKEGLSCIN